MTWGPFLWDLGFAVGWAGLFLFAMLWYEERQWSKRCYAAYLRGREWGDIIGRHANEMWAALSRMQLPREPPPLSETPTLAMPKDQLLARATGWLPRFKRKGEW